jgi:pimeloyl-ACP methyl ester carboxylesterase
MTDVVPKTRFQPIGDVELQFLEYSGGRPPIILMHATGFLPWLWHPIARRLAGSHRVLAPYFCDHRKAELDDGGLRWMTLADDMARFCTELDIRKPILVGHSMGGTVMALAAAAFHLEAAGLILIEPIFYPDDYYNTRIEVEDHPLASKSLRRRSQWEDAASLKAYLKSKPLFARWDDEFLDLYIEHGTVPKPDVGLELTCPPPREAALFMGGMHYNPWPLLPEIQCPVLVLEGADSANRSFINLEKVAASFPHGRFQRMADAGHLLVMEKPVEVLKIIETFVASIR